MRLMIATDAWHPQVNGVVRSLEATVAEVRALGAEVRLVTPQGFRSVALPTYPEIRLAMVGAATLGRVLDDWRPDHVHIATEGPIGLAARMACRRRNRGFTTSYHTHFPEYLVARAPVPRAATYACLRWFHNGGQGTMVATETLAGELAARGFRNLMRWSRGVDPTLFRPRPWSILDLPRPIHLYVGRVAVEKNVEALLRLDLPGSTVVVGDGPALEALRLRYPKAHFVGARTGEHLAETYASADIFVFPSRTDTFGIVLLEALASGLPVAGFPVAGPRDVIGTSRAGVLDEDLRRACQGALKISRAHARQTALTFTWRESARQFLDNIATARRHAATRQPAWAL